MKLIREFKHVKAELAKCFLGISKEVKIIFKCKMCNLSQKCNQNEPLVKRYQKDHGQK